MPGLARTSAPARVALLALGAFSLGLLALAAPCSLAAPSLSGPSGLVVVPDAAAVQPGHLEVAARRVSASNDWVTIAGNLGLWQGCEVGFMWKDPEAGSTETTVNLKLAFEPTEENDWQVAFGIWDVSDEVQRTWYAVAGMRAAPLLKERPLAGKQNKRRAEVERWRAKAARLLGPDHQWLCLGFGSGGAASRLHGGFVGLNLGVFALDWDGDDWNTTFRLGSQSGVDFGWAEGDFFWGVWGRREF